MTRPLAGRPGTLPSLSLAYPRSLGVYDDYQDAQRAVDYLSDEQFPVQNCMIVGPELKQVERITGRLAYSWVCCSGSSPAAATSRP
jgi:hypothetical protein